MYIHTYFRYKPGSTKEMTQWQREKGASRVFSLKTTSRLPSQLLMLSVTSNKIQLFNMIVDDFKQKPFSADQNKIVITGPDPVPFECNGESIARPDMPNLEEEADTIIVCQVNSQQDDMPAAVVGDDTDIFLQLLHFVHTGSITCKVIQCHFIVASIVASTKI